ncbi:MAG: CPBP family intramembrane metalloprotease [bacterium]|nr:CPBP family intramembrane metalloprotease [bacterium]
MAPLLLPLMIGAPAVVVIALLAFHDVFAVFASYHVGICVLLPMAVNLGWRRLGWSDHVGTLGLTGPGTRRGLALGTALGAASAVLILAAFQLRGTEWLANNAVTATLESWGATSDRWPALVLFMVVVNGPAEELFWRGFVANEMADVRSRANRLLLPSACYASYHAVTVLLLVRSLEAAALMLTAVFGAGIFWAWLRDRTGSVWPALLSHAAATAAYMAVALPLLTN